MKVFVNAIDKIKAQTIRVMRFIYEAAIETAFKILADNTAVGGIPENRRAFLIKRVDPDVVRMMWNAMDEQFNLIRIVFLRA